MTLKAERRGGVLTLLLDRPHKAHAYDRTLLQALDKALSHHDSKVIVIGSTGTGAFCAGADLDEMKTASPEDARSLYSQAVFDRLAKLSVVSIAAIQGPAVAGGFELALACDIRLASPKARFSLPEVRLGLIPSAGGCTRLPELVGQSRAKQIILGGHELQAEEALSWGLLSRIVEDPLLAAQKWAEQIAEFDPQALGLAKTVLRGESDDRLELERLAQTVLYAKKGPRRD